MEAGEQLISFPCSSANTSSGVSDSFDIANPNQAKQMETDLESLAFHEKLQLHDAREEDEEFSFACANPDGSPVSADDAFYNGQIRPMYPLFNRDLLFADDSETTTDRPPSLRPPLRKVFVENRESESESESELEGAVEEGTYCEWSPAPPELGNKSNSTGFSKLWRFRDLMMHRSSSDGKDAFVFLNNPSTTKSSKNKQPHKPQTETRTRRSSTSEGEPVPKHARPQTLSSAHERLYVTSRAKKEVDRRRSYLPYRQDLVGFFTNVNGFTKNVHPF